MDSESSVSEWLDKLKDGDQRAAQELWDHFSPRLMGVARGGLAEGLRRVEDEEDVLVSVFNCLCQGAREGRFSELRDRHDLWHLLLKITRRRASNQRRRLMAQKRGGGIVRGDSVNGDRFDAGENPGLDVTDPSPTPAAIVEMNEQFGHLFDLLPDENLRLIAKLKLQSYTNAEIAERLNIVERTVERKLHTIREIWEEER